MKRTTYQVPELRDENDNIIQQGTYGKESPLVNSTNDGVLDYINNNLMYLYDNTMGGTGGEINTETITGKTGTITTLTVTTVKAGTVTADALNGPLTGNVTGDLNGNVTGNLTGNVKGNLTGNVAGTADKAVADGKGNNIQTTYAKKSDLSSSLSTTSLTVSGETSVPTANAGNSSKAIANTEYVQGELTNYLPLSGGTVTGDLTVTGALDGTATNATNDANGNPIAGTYLPLAGGTMTGPIQYVENGKVFAIGNTTTGNVDLGWSWANSEGAGLALRSTDYSSPGGFMLYARDANNTCFLTGKPDGNLAWNGQPLLPVGIVQAFAGTTIPSGWLLCDGSAVSRTTYANLYACIGTTYGAGDGSTTFNLPNLIDKFVEGSATAGTVKSAGLPNITGSFDLRPVTGGQNVTWPERNGAIEGIELTGGSSRCVAQGSDYGSAVRVTLDASRSSAIYGKSTTVQPPALTMRYIIKY